MIRISSSRRTNTIEHCLHNQSIYDIFQSKMFIQYITRVYSPQNFNITHIDIINLHVNPQTYYF